MRNYDGYECGSDCRGRSDSRGDYFGDGVEKFVHVAALHYLSTTCNMERALCPAKLHSLRETGISNTENNNQGLTTL